MKKVCVFIFLFLLVLSVPSWADSTATANAGAQAGASAQANPVITTGATAQAAGGSAQATGGSAQAGSQATGGSVSVGDISPSNSNKVRVNVTPEISPSNSVANSVEVNPVIKPSQGQKQSVDNHPSVNVNSGQTVAPKTSSRVSIDNHSKTRIKNFNRQFISPGYGPQGGTMQLFFPPREFGIVWNFQPPVSGEWEFSNKEEKIKVKRFKLHRYVKSFHPLRRVKVAVGKVNVKGVLIAEVAAEADRKEDSRSLQVAVIDKLAHMGANVIVVEANGVKFIPRSHYSGIIMSGSAGGIMAQDEKVAVSGGSGAGVGNTELQIQTFPIVQAKGYRGEIIKVESSSQTGAEKVKDHKKEKWQAIQK